MKTILLLAQLLALTTAFGATLFGKNKYGLKLDGTVISVSPKRVGNNKQWDIGLLMQVRNDGKEPLILLRPAVYRLGDMKVELFRAVDSSSVFTKVLPTFYEPDLNHSFLRSFLKRIDLPEPPPTATVIIEPGKYFEFNDSVRIEDNYTTTDSVVQNQSILTKEIGIPVSDISALRVEYHVSFSKFHMNPDFLENLQQRWRRFGLLVLGDRGDFTLRSEKILNIRGNN